MTEPTVTRTGRAVALSIGVSLGIQGMNLVTGVLLAKALGPVGRGELTAVLLWPSLLSVIGSLGTSDALTVSAAKDGGGTGALIGTGIGLAVIQSVVLCGVGLLILPLVLGRFDHATLASADLMLTFIPLNLATLYLMGILNGRGRIHEFNLIRGVVILLTMVTLVGTAITVGLTVRRAVFAYLLANGLTLAFTAYRTLRGQGLPSYEPELARRLLSFGLRSHTSNVPVLLNARLDQLLVSLFLAPRLLGLYTVASTFSVLTSLVGLSIAPVALSSIARERDDVVRRERACLLAIATIGCALFVVIPLIVVAPQAIRLVFGASYVSASSAGRVLLLAGAVFALNRTLESILKGVGRPLEAGYAELLALGVTLVSLCVLLPLFHLTGAATASFAGGSASCILLLRRTTSALEVSPARLLMPTGPVLARFRNLLRRP